MGYSLKRLNDSQKKAVTWGASPLMVIAGAGSGKTRVLTYRVAYLIKKKGVLPSRLFVTTFTKAASEEMIERLIPLIGERKSERLRAGTFHSLCFAILRDIIEEADGGGSYESPDVLQGGGQWMTILGIINSYRVTSNHNKLSTKDIKALIAKISQFKNDGLRVKDVKKLSQEEAKKYEYKEIEDEGKEKEKFSKMYTYYMVYRDYEKKLKKDNKIDFDDMLIKTYYILANKKNKKILNKVRRKIEHILVDECQDLNNIQHMLVKILAGDNNRCITLVGDDWQTLYGFRGAKVEALMEFQRFYEADIVKLEQNYRSTKKIVGYGNDLIKHNEIQIKKTLYTTNDEGADATLIVSEDEDDEAYSVVDKIERYLNEGYDLSDIAILYRTNAQSRAIVDDLIISCIPHKVYSREGFYDRKEIRDLISYIRIFNNPYDAELEDFKRIINRPARYLTARFIDMVEDLQIEHGHETYWSAMLAWRSIPDLSNRQQVAIEKFVSMIETCSQLHLDKPFITEDLLALIVSETGYLDWVNKEKAKNSDINTDDPDNDNIMNIDAFITGCERFKTPDEFLIFIDSMNRDDEEEGDDYVHLMTIHKSKGKEFPIVIIMGVSTRLMPHHLADDHEEERRIFYVALTRAMEHLTISCIFGKFGRYHVNPSWYIKEIGLDKELNALVSRAQPNLKVDFFKGMINTIDDKSTKENTEKPAIEKIRSRAIHIGNATKIVESLDDIALKYELVDEQTGEMKESPMPQDTES